MEAPFPNCNITGVYASENKFDTDNQVELAYTYAVNTLDGGHFSTKVTKEDGTVLLDLPEAFHAFMSEFPDLPDKFIVGIQYGTFDNQQQYSRVFGIDGVFAVEDFKSQAAVVTFPNPAESVINFQSQTRIVRAKLFDSRGMLVQDCQQPELKAVSIENVSAGLYVLQLTDSNDGMFVQKIVVR